MLACGALLDDICSTSHELYMISSYVLAANGTRGRALRLYSQAC
jgi:hypothetical protein